MNLVNHDLFITVKTGPFYLLYMLLHAKFSHWMHQPWATDQVQWTFYEVDLSRIVGSTVTTEKVVTQVFFFVLLLDGADYPTWQTVIYPGKQYCGRERMVGTCGLRFSRKLDNIFTGLSLRFEGAGYDWIVRKHLLAATYLFITVCGKFGANSCFCRWCNHPVTYVC